jgi:hypothetical protein
VDWNSLFSSFFGMVRVKVACKDISKIPKRRWFEMQKKLYLVQFKVEGEDGLADGGDDDGGDNGDQGNREDNGMEEIDHAPE